jgi:hypothetical protein
MERQPEQCKLEFGAKRCGKRKKLAWITFHIEDECVNIARWGEDDYKERRDVVYNKASQWGVERTRRREGRRPGEKALASDFLVDS